MRKTIAVIGAMLLVTSVASAASIDVIPGAAMNGTSFGLEATFDGVTSAAFVRDDTPANESIYRAEFWFDPNNITMADGTFHVIFRATQEVPFRAAYQIMIVKKSGLTRLWCRVVNNTGTVRFTNRINIDDSGPQLIQTEWVQSDLPGVLNGSITMTILDGTAAGASVSSGANNSTIGVDFVLMGAVGNINATTTGTHYFDEFASFRTLAP